MTSDKLPRGMIILIAPGLQNMTERNSLVSMQGVTNSLALIEA